MTDPYDFDFDGDLDRDVDDDAYDFDRDVDAVTAQDEGWGHGRERDDAPTISTLPMTRRDMEAIYASSMRDMSSFLAKKRNPPAAPSTVADYAISGAEVIGGAMAAAYLAQRNRRAGHLLPIGATLGGLLLIASYVQGNKHLMFGGLGLLAGAGAVWAAGHGTLAAPGPEDPNVWSAEEVSTAAAARDAAGQFRMPAATPSPAVRASSAFAPTPPPFAPGISAFDVQAPLRRNT